MLLRLGIVVFAELRWLVVDDLLPYRVCLDGKFH
ncbi:Uncharacterised protein [Vibrio cholerae]|nr:Uncharacterised protein [Vibrio cholerae]